MIQPTVPVVEAAPCEAIELSINTSVIKTFHFPENFPSLQFSFDYAEINMFEYKYDMRGTRGQNFVRIKCSEVAKCNIFVTTGKIYFHYCDYKSLSNVFKGLCWIAQTPTHTNLLVQAYFQNHLK